MSEPRVLVTGASGFVGRWTLEPLLAAGYEVHAVCRREPPPAPAGVRWQRADLLAPDGHDALLAEVAPTHLLHLAWHAEHTSFWTSAENVRWAAATLALVHAFAAHGGNRVAVAGTCAEYRWGDAGRCVEGITPLEPATLYGVAKHATHTLLDAAQDGLGIELAWGRIFLLYGPGEAPQRLVAAVASALVAGERAATGDGTQVRDFLHVGDVGAALVALLDSPVCGAVNIGSGVGLALLEVITEIGVAVGRPDLLDVGALASRPGDPAQLVADVTRLRDEVGFVPSFELRDGIEQTVAWWRDALAAG